MYEECKEVLLFQKYGQRMDSEHYLKKIRIMIQSVLGSETVAPYEEICDLQGRQHVGFASLQESEP